MIYLSEIINKKIYHEGKPLGKVLDLIVAEDRYNPAISKLLIKNAGKKYIVHADALSYKQKRWIAKEPQLGVFQYENRMFFLVEDLLDKQVIDINGRRLVRVNDVLLKENGALKPEGIDIGFAGIFRRLGLPNLFGLKTITLPWGLIEAFDYQTGNVQIKVTQNRLNTFHPAEIADILEDAGTKERLGIVESLDAQKAAAAIEEADEETQSAILEQVDSSTLKTITGRMHLSELADIIRTINPFTERQIIKSLNKEQANELQRLMVFDDNEAGGIMSVSFYTIPADKTVREVLELLSTKYSKPESLIIVNTENELIGVVNSRNIINVDFETQLIDLPRHELSVNEHDQFHEIFKIFAEYNIRTLPVVDTENHVVGIIRIDQILEHLQEEEEKDDVV